MKALLAFLMLLMAASAQAQPRVYNQAELDALLAPIALYPDPLLSQVLIAATYPDDVREAAAWSRANAHLKGDEAVRAAEPMPWDPSLKALLAYPDLLARMDESPQWTADLGAAFLAQEPQVMETVQALRRRAQASGFLNSDGYQSVQDYGSYIVVQPVHSHIVYVPWYNPVVVYGPWWWHSHRPVAWRPWHPRPAAFVSPSVHRPAVDWHRKHVTRSPIHRALGVNRPARIQPRPAAHGERSFRPSYIHNHAQQAQRARPIVQGAQIPPRLAMREERRRPQAQQRPAPIRNNVHQAQAARPAIQRALTQPRFGELRRESRPEPRGQHRAQGRQQHRGNGRGRD